MPSTHTSLTYHVVFSTKKRERRIAVELRHRIHDFLGGCIRTAGGYPLRIGGTDDHVHLLAGLRPTHCLADVIRDVKRATSSWIHDELRVPHFAWQEGYGGFTVSHDRIPGLVRYIENQQEHHRKRTFEEEYVELRREFGIDFDERYLW